MLNVRLLSDLFLEVKLLEFIKRVVFELMEIKFMWFFKLILGDMKEEREIGISII